MNTWIILSFALLGVGCAGWAYLKTPERYRSTGNPCVSPLAENRCKQCSSTHVIQGRLTPVSSETSTLCFTSEQTNQGSFWKSLFKSKEEVQLHYAFMNLQKNQYNFCIDCGLVYGFSDTYPFEKYRQNFGENALLQKLGIPVLETSEHDIKA